MISRRHFIHGAALTLGGVGAAAATQVGGPLSADERALHALNRLGYGPRPADVEAIARLGAQAWLQQFLTQQIGPVRPALPESLSSRLQSLATMQLSQSGLIGRYREANSAAARDAGSMSDAQIAVARAQARRELVQPVRVEAASQRLLRAMQSPAQLEEVLVEFWFNHFNVFAGKGLVAVLAGDYERWAIRPHVFGSFRDMLGATAKHPAMLVYLDNAQSVAPGYRPPGRAAALNPNPARPTGLNENYARELMELHTLGVDGGYTQRDVTELARMLTGWTFNYQAAQRGRSGDLFEFDPNRHDGGSKHWLGRAVRSAGQAEGEMALDVLAAHPATAAHLGFKLAQAFVADEPPPALVARLADRFMASGGDLKSVTQTLINADEFWRREAFGAKFKTPYQYLVSTLRALDATDPPDLQPLLQVLAQAGMPLHGAPTPDGYKNTAAAWMNPEALAQRLQFAGKLAERRLRRDAPSDTAALLTTLGVLLRDSTRASVADAPANLQTALLLGSPDFMRH